jgi:xylan 1,4-beta-xylosidase
MSRVLVRRYCVDRTHSNSYTVWKSMGSPQEPTSEEYSMLERAGQLEMANSPEWVDSNRGEIEMKFALPRQAVTLIQASW